MSQIDDFADIVRKLGRAANWFITRQIKDRSLAGEQERLARSAERSFSELLELKAHERGDEPFLRFYERTLSLNGINQRSNRVARRLSSYGAGPGQAAAIMMGNCPEWLIVFYALQKLGMCAVPVNTGLQGEDLGHLLRHTESRFLFTDHELLGRFDDVRETLDKIERVIVNTDDADSRFRLPDWADALDHYLQEDLAAGNLDIEFDRNNICLIMYTSGTTGPPKGVVYTYAHSGVTLLGIAAHVFYEKDDLLYTCLPLFHANALFFTVTEAMWRDLRVGLGRCFSPGSFWGEVRMYRATTFSAMGSMTTVLMKQPRRPNDRENPVRTVLTAGCPAAVWREFEERFAVKVYEGYDAVDGGGFATFNMGNAPAGSIGKPVVRFRIIDEKGDDAREGEPGELITWVGRRKGVVNYFKDEKADAEKVREGWLYTGDLVYKDENGYLYFAGRVNESIRRGGKNISAYQLDREVEKHPDLLECAAYPIRSEPGEDDIMISVAPLEGRRLDPATLHQWIAEHLPEHMVPRYVNVVERLPKTGTHWVIKRELMKAGVTGTTIDFGKKK